MDKASIFSAIKIIIYFGLWYALNALYNVYTKKVLRIAEIPWMLALTQLIAGCCWFLPMWITGLRKAPKIATSDFKWLLNLGLWHMCVNVAGTIAITQGGVSFFQIIKAAEPIFTCAAAAIFFREIYHPVVYLSILPVIVGVSYASVSTLDFSWVCVIGAMVSNAGSVFRAIFTKPVLQNPPEHCENIDPGNLFSLVTLATIVIVAPLATVMEVGELFDVVQTAVDENEDLTHSSLALKMFLSGIFFYTYNEVAFFALDEVDPVTHAVGNALKRVVVIAAAVMFLGESMTTETLIGTVIAIAGVLGYSLSKNHFSSKKKEYAELSTNAEQEGLVKHRMSMSEDDANAP